MSDVGELTPQEKSIMLARAAGWKHKSGYLRYPNGLTVWGHEQGSCTYPSVAGDKQWPDLYDTRNMDLAWRVLDWAKQILTSDDAPQDWVARHMDLWHTVADNMGDPLAQGMWLDKCVELAKLVSQERHDA